MRARPCPAAEIMAVDLLPTCLTLGAAPRSSHLPLAVTDGSLLVDGPATGTIGDRFLGFSVSLHDSGRRLQHRACSGRLQGRRQGLTILSCVNVASPRPLLPFLSTQIPISTFCGSVIDSGTCTAAHVWPSADA